jgi:formamidase
VVISGALDLNQLRGIRVDPRKRLASQPGLGHNRWHPDLRPALEVDSGEVFVLETIDASDATVTRSSPDTPWDVALIHPLTGPVYIAGAKPDDVLEIEILDVGTGDTGTSSIHPSEGLLGGWIDRQETIVWDLRDGFARSPAIPGVSIPAAPFPGCIGVAPSAAYVAQARRRETALAQLGAPTAVDHEPGAVPASVIDGLRTLPPRENGGNMDVRQLTAGSRLFVRVQVESMVACSPSVTCISLRATVSSAPPRSRRRAGSPCGVRRTTHPHGHREILSSFRRRNATAYG